MMIEVRDMYNSKSEYKGTTAGVYLYNMVVRLSGLGYSEICSTIIKTITTELNGIMADPEPFEDKPETPEEAADHGAEWAIEVITSAVDRKFLRDMSESEVDALISAARLIAEKTGIRPSILPSGKTFDTMTGVRRADIDETCADVKLWWQEYQDGPCWGERLESYGLC